MGGVILIRFSFLRSRKSFASLKNQLSLLVKRASVNAEQESEARAKERTRRSTQRRDGTTIRLRMRLSLTTIRKRKSHDVRTTSKVNMIERLTQRAHLGVAFLAKMIEPKQAANSNWFFQKIFGEGEFIAAGQMHIPPKSQKPSKSTKDNTYVRTTFTSLL